MLSESDLEDQTERGIWTALPWRSGLWLNRKYPLELGDWGTVTSGEKEVEGKGL